MYQQDNDNMKVSQQIKLLFTMLTPSEREILISELSTDQPQTQRVDGNVSSCPYCGNAHFVKNGKNKGHIRYKCKSCNRNFNSFTGTAYQGIKKQ